MMEERHWVIVYNNITDECRIMQLLNEWLHFKYAGSRDVQPDWCQLGFYETRNDAYQAFIDLAHKKN